MSGAQGRGSWQRTRPTAGPGVGKTERVAHEPWVCCEGGGEQAGLGPSGELGTRKSALEILKNAFWLLPYPETWLHLSLLSPQTPQNWHPQPPGKQSQGCVGQQRTACTIPIPQAGLSASHPLISDDPEVTLGSDDPSPVVCFSPDNRGLLVSRTSTDSPLMKSILKNQI